MRLVEGISPQYLLRVIYISGDLFVYGGLSNTFTFVRGGAFEILGFVTLPIGWTGLTTILLCISYIVVNLVA